jgi:hypothetical protein
MKDIRTRSSIRYVRRDLEDVKKALLAALKEKPPRSIKQISKSLGYATVSTVDRLFPKICRKIRIRYHRSQPAKVPYRRIPIDDSIREVLLHAQNDERPPSTYILARRMGYESPAVLLRRFPELCASINDRRAKWKRSEMKTIEKALEEGLDEVPAPSLNNLAIRLGHCNATTISKHFPELCSLISERYNSCLRQRRDNIREELRSALAEPMPPTLREIGRRFGHAPPYLGVNFPALAQAITKRRKKRLKQLSLARMKKAQRRVRRVAKKLYSDGVYPSLRRVRAKLAGETPLDTKEFSDVLREVRKELSLPHRIGLSI